MAFLDEIKQFDSSELKETETHVRYDGFVAELQPDVKVGIVVEDQIFVGSQDLAFEEETLQTLGVTTIVNLASRIPEMFPLHFNYVQHPVLDLPETDIIKHFHTLKPQLDAAVSNGGRVLLHWYACFSEKLDRAVN